MGNAPVNDVGGADSLGERSHAALHLGDHAPANNARRNEVAGLLDVEAIEKGVGIVKVFKNPRRVGKENELLGIESRRNFPAQRCRH